MLCKKGKLALCSWRYGIAYIGLLGNTFMYGMRLNLSLAIVCMVKRTANGNDTANNVTSFNQSNISRAGDDTCQEINGNSNSSDVEGTFEWSRSMQGMILSVYFYGYIITQIPGGWLAKRYGARITLAGGLSLSCLCTFLTPVAAKTSVYFVLALRFFAGLGSGVNFPAYHTLWSYWAPIYERSKLLSICYAGTMVGNILTYFISGYLCVYGFDGGWPSIFYVIGIVEVAWLVLFVTLVYDTPAKHPYITEEERNFIQKDTGRQVHADKKRRTPWPTFFKSAPVWAILVAHVCNNYCQYTLMVCLPTYMRDVLKFDMKQNGLYSALPYLTMLFWTLVFGQIADIMRERGVRTVVVRKVYQTLGSIPPGIFLVGASFVSCDERMVAVGCLIACVGFTSFNRSGYVVNHLDIAPRYAGLLLGLTNTFATLPGIIAPIAVGQLTTNGTREEWQTVFYICGAVYLFGTIIFAIFGSGVVQPWAKEVHAPMETIACEYKDDDDSEAEL